MSHRPYPDADRALAQLQRGRVPRPPISTFAAPFVDLEEFSRRMRASGDTVGAIVARMRARQAGKTAITAAIADQAVKAGEHVHVAGRRDGVRCAGGDEACTLPKTEPEKAPAMCAGCGHAQHPPGTECEAGVDHGPKRWHRCLCLATPGASRACPPQMDCQGGTLGFSDVWHLRQGRSLRGMNGETITPDVLAERQPTDTVIGE